MIISSAEFITSSVDYKKCPPPIRPEFAFIGRSNVGKSSLINMLTGVKNLAKTSSTPGKTQVINHFLINQKWYMVDLPGYGFAKTSKANREKWEKMIRDYLQNRENLMTTVILIDSRLTPQAIDMEFIHWMGECNLPFCLVFTKCDKTRKGELARNVANYKNELLKTWEELPPVFITSAEKGTGRDEVLNYIDDTSALFE